MSDVGRQKPSAEKPVVGDSGQTATDDKGKSKPSLSPQAVVVPSKRLRLNPIKDHKSDNYEDLQLEFSPGLFSSLEKYLPPTLLSNNRDQKFKFMEEVVLKYLPHDERLTVEKLRDYRDLIMWNYEPLHKEIYSFHPTFFFTPSFSKAIADDTVESFRRVMSEPYPGVFTFEIFNPRFCDLLIAEIEHFEKWVAETKFRILRPNKMNKFGVVLDDFGFETILDKLVEKYICPIARVFYPEVGGATLDSHHGFVVEYGEGRDSGLGFHVDDSEVTLNVCLGKQFSGGDLHFRGTRCEKHVNTKVLSESEIFEYAHVPGRAVLHRGNHRHAVRSTTTGHRINLLLWCRSSVFRELKKYRKDFPLWCGECLSAQKEKQQSSLAAMRLELLGKED